MTDWSALPAGYLPALPLAAAGAVSLLRGDTRGAGVAAGISDSGAVAAGYAALGRYRLLCCASAATAAALALRPHTEAPAPFALLYAITLIASLGCAALHGFRPGRPESAEETAEAERTCGYAYLSAALAMICFFAQASYMCVCFAALSAFTASVACGRTKALIPAAIACLLLLAGAAFSAHDAGVDFTGPFLALREYPGMRAAAPLFTFAGAALLAAAPAKPDKGDPASAAARAALAVMPAFAASFVLLRLFQGTEWLAMVGTAATFAAAVRAISATRIHSSLRAILICQTGTAAAAIGAGDPLSLTAAAGSMCCALPAMMLMHAGAETAARSALWKTRMPRGTAAFAGVCAMIGALCICGMPLTSGYVFRVLPAFLHEDGSVWMRLSLTAAPCLLIAACGSVRHAFFGAPEGQTRDAMCDSAGENAGLERTGLAGLAVMCLLPGWPGLTQQTLYALLPQTPDFSLYAPATLIGHLESLYFAAAAYLAFRPWVKCASATRAAPRTPRRPFYEHETVLEWKASWHRYRRRHQAKREAHAFMVDQHPPAASFHRLSPAVTTTEATRRADSLLGKIVQTLETPAAPRSAAHGLCLWLAAWVMYGLWHLLTS